MVTDQISIIIPCYNEEANLRRGVLHQIDRFLATQKFQYELIIANDQSTDGSQQLIDQFARQHRYVKAFTFPKGGKPGALWHGLQKAQYPYVLFTDMDQSTPLKEIKKFLPYYRQGIDIIIGSRGLNRPGNSLIRRFGSRVFSSLRNILLTTHITDTQCGFKSMKTSIALEIFPQLQVIKNIQNGHGWRVTAYDVELLFIANQHGYQIKEIPVEWNNEDTSTTKGDANARYLRESQQMAKEVWRIFTNHLLGKYDTKS